MEVVDRRQGRLGELVLRSGGGHFEIVSNGVFLMDTRAGGSERLLVRAALDRLARPADLLIGGLGVGFSLAEAVRSPHARTVTVVECEPAVIAWHATHLRAYSAGALNDPRVRIVCADLLETLRACRDRYDAICLDIDNGPDWTVGEANAALYAAEGLDLLAARLRPGGVVAFWSAAPAPAFEERLARRFQEVSARPVPVTRGVPDIVYLASARPA